MGSMGWGRRLGRGRSALLAALVLSALALAPLGTSALAQTVRAGRLIVTVEGGFTPHTLPTSHPGSITLSARSTIRTSDGSHLPALEELSLKFDKHTGVYTKGLPGVLNQ